MGMYHFTKRERQLGLVSENDQMMKVEGLYGLNCVLSKAERVWVITYEVSIVNRYNLTDVACLVFGRFETLFNWYYFKNAKGDWGSFLEMIKWWKWKAFMGWIAYCLKRNECGVITRCLLWTDIIWQIWCAIVLSRFEILFNWYYFKNAKGNWGSFLKMIKWWKWKAFMGWIVKRNECGVITRCLLWKDSIWQIGCAIVLSRFETLFTTSKMRKSIVGSFLVMIKWWKEKAFMGWIA